MTLEQLLHDLELRVKKLEELAHPPITFIVDENGYIRVADAEKPNGEKL